MMRPGSSLARWPQGLAGATLGRCDSDEDIGAFVALARPEAVVHTACAYGRAGETTLQLFDANLRFGLVLLEALAQTGSPQVPVSFLNTGTALDPTVSPYALSKQQFSSWGRAFASQPKSALQFINVHLQHMYGPGDDASKFTAHVLRACQSHRPELALTAGEQQRDFIFIDDVVNAYATLLTHRQKLAPCEDIDVGSGEAPSIRSFVETVHRITRSTTRLLFGAIPYRPNEAMHCQADITRLRELGWSPSFSLESGLKRTLEMEFGI
jgi:nucleoside-diphosphate-sugar epimerase